MKKIIAALAAAAALLCASAHAYTVTNAATGGTNSVSAPVPAITITNAAQALGLPAWVPQVFGDFTSAFVDAQPYFTNDIGDIALGGLYDKAATKGRLGFFAEASVPVAAQASIGYGMAYIGQHWREGTLNIQLGTTVTNLLGLGKFYGYVASGPCYDLTSQTVGAYNFVGMIKTWDISSKVKLSAGGGAGDFSTLPGTCYEGHVDIEYHF